MPSVAPRPPIGSYDDGEQSRSRASLIAVRESRHSPGRSSSCLPQFDPLVVFGGDSSLRARSADGSGRDFRGWPRGFAPSSYKPADSRSSIRARPSSQSGRAADQPFRGAIIRRRHDGLGIADRHPLFRPRPDRRERHAGPLASHASRSRRNGGLVHADDLVLVPATISMAVTPRDLQPDLAAWLESVATNKVLSPGITPAGGTPSTRSGRCSPLDAGRRFGRGAYHGVVSAEHEVCPRASPPVRGGSTRKRELDALDRAPVPLPGPVGDAPIFALCTILPSRRSVIRAACVLPSKLWALDLRLAAPPLRGHCRAQCQGFVARPLPLRRRRRRSLPPPPALAALSVVRRARV